MCELWRLTAEEGVDTEEAEDQAQELSEDRRDGEAGEWRDTGQGQDTYLLGILFMEDHLIRYEVGRRYLYLTLS